MFLFHLLLSCLQVLPCWNVLGPWILFYAMANMLWNSKRRWSQHLNYDVNCCFPREITFDNVLQKIEPFQTPTRSCSFMDNSLKYDNTFNYSHNAETVGWKILHSEVHNARLFQLFKNYFVFCWNCSEIMCHLYKPYQMSS